MIFFRKKVQRELSRLDKVCVHEAAHIVFSRLIKKVDKSYPDCTMVSIIKNESSLGRTDSGRVVEYGTITGKNQVDELKRMPKPLQMAEIMNLISGYLAQEFWVDPQAQMSFEDIPLRVSNTLSDINKAELIASNITSDYKAKTNSSGKWVLNEKNLELLNSLKSAVNQILKNCRVERAIYITAKSICLKREIGGKDMEYLTRRIDKILGNRINILEYLK